VTERTVLVKVPLLDEVLEPPPPGRVRALKRHLIQSLRDLAGARRPDKLIQRPSPVPSGFAAKVLAAGCATCRGLCCTGGGDHAYIDERTMARVHRDNPELGARAVIRRYLERLPALSARGSCLFHGPAGCTLGRGLRAELCNAYYCNGLRDFLRRSPEPTRARVVAARDGRERRSPVLTPVDARSRR
jgi:hypothetical protein